MTLDQFWYPPNYIPTFNWLLWEMRWFEFLIKLLLASTTSKTAPTKYFWNSLKSTHFSQQLIWGINLRWASKLIQSHFPNEDVVDDTSAVMVDRFPTRSRGFWKSKQKVRYSLVLINCMPYSFCLSRLWKMFTLFSGTCSGQPMAILVVEFHIGGWKSNRRLRVKSFKGFFDISAPTLTHPPLHLRALLTNSLQRDSFPAHHPPAAPNGNGSKDWGRVRAPDAHHHTSDAAVFFPKIILTNFTI